MAFSDRLAQREMSRLFISIFLIITTFFSLPALAKVHEYTLKNGLQVVVKPDLRAPIAAVHVWYKVGSSYEPTGLTGISHVVEHMMFKGTSKYPAGSVSNIIAKNGGDENAYTSYDYTNYQHTIAADKIDLILEIEADRMSNLNFTDQQFEKERQVVLEERRVRTDDSPVGKTYEAFHAFAFQNSGYKHPIIGWKEDLNAMTADDVRRWYKKWYAPNNAVLIVVGQVDPDQVYQKAQQYFSEIPKKDIPVVKATREPPQIMSKSAKVRLKAKQPHIFLGFKVPTLNTTDVEWEPYALKVLSAIISGYNSSRLDKKVVRGDAIAAYTSSDYSAFSRLEDLLTISSTVNPNQDITSLKSKILTELDLIKSKGITASELERIKVQVAAEDVFTQDSIGHQANLIGYLETVGLKHTLLDKWVENIQNVTVQQVHQVAKKYLNEDFMIVTELVPTS